MDDEPSNRLPSMRNVDRLEKAIRALCEARLYPGARDVVDAATDITANTFLMLLEGNRPEVAKDFWLEVGMKRGKYPNTKLVNYVIDETPPELRRIVQEAANQITSGVSILERDFKPVRMPTLPEVLAEMDRISDGKGLSELHRLWMSHLSGRTADQKRDDQDLIKIGKLKLREEEASKRGMTVQELAEEEEKQRQEADRLAEEARWNEYVSGGTVVIDREPTGRHVVVCPAAPEQGTATVPPKMPEPEFLWLKVGAIYVEHGGKLVQLSEPDCERIRACMTKH